MKHWGQCDLQDIVVDELKIKTEKSQVIFLTFKKLLNTDFKVCLYCYLTHHLITNDLGQKDVLFFSIL